LGQKGDWVVMASWLLQLRSLLLLPADSPAQQAAAAEADQLRGRLISLQEIQTLAAWLDRRPQLGHDVFARGQPELFGTAVETGHEVDVIAFLGVDHNRRLGPSADASHQFPDSFIAFLADAPILSFRFGCSGSGP
jgi:chromatin segregation and condensation protein Rec8/ScpA/Scc1 (kleisin family)